MNGTVSTSYTAREDHIPRQRHAIAAERITFHSGCAARPPIRSDMPDCGARYGSAVQDTVPASHRQAIGARAMAGVAFAGARPADGWTAASLEEISHAVAARDWEYAQALLEQLRSVLAGGTGPADGAPSSTGGRLSSGEPYEPLIEPLRARELEVMVLVAAGHSNQQIAEQLIVSVGTVRWHLKNIYSKLGVHSRTQAVAQVRARGLLN